MHTRHYLIGTLFAAFLVGPTLATDKPATDKPITDKPAADKPLAKMTCEDFLGLDDDFQPKAVYWAVGYGKGDKPETAILDVEGTETVIPFITEECEKAPKESFWQKVKDHLKKLEKKL